MTEAKLALFNYLFNELKIRKLTSEAHVKNIASNKTNESLGYKYIGTYKKHSRSKVTNKIHDLKLYELMKRDWIKMVPKIRKKITNYGKELSGLRKKVIFLDFKNRD